MKPNVFKRFLLAEFNPVIGFYLTRYFRYGEASFLAKFTKIYKLFLRNLSVIYEKSIMEIGVS
jgi:hypothetical protein